jgi:hypothetical protein
MYLQLGRLDGFSISDIDLDVDIKRRGRAGCTEEKRIEWMRGCVGKAFK